MSKQGQKISTKTAASFRIFIQTKLQLVQLDGGSTVGLVFSDLSQLIAGNTPSRDVRANGNVTIETSIYFPRFLVILFFTALKQLGYNKVESYLSPND